MWIKRANKCEKSNIEETEKPRFIKKFQTTKSVSKAVLEISALGIFSLEINGRKIQEYFMPGYTNYNKFVYLCRYDLTQDMQKENILCVTVGDGWFSGRLGYFRAKTFGTELCLYAKLTITYQDGSSEIIQTDESWKVQDSEILHADFFDGQEIDERLRKDPSQIYNLLPNAIFAKEERTFRLYDMEPIVCVRTLQPKILKKSNKLLLDFEQNFAGVVAFDAIGESGKKIIIRHAEVLDENGELYVANLRRASCTDTLVLSDKPAHFAPEFTYHGFRYAEISVENGDISDVEISNIQGLVYSQDLKRTGYFECSNEIVNKIYQNVYWGQISNFISVPTDCPQRDERLGWTGDAQIFCDTAMYNADCEKFYKSYLDLVRADCLENGSVPGFVPFECRIERGTHGTPCWGDAIAVMPYMHYLAYGDISIIQDNLPAAKKWIEYYRSYLEEGVVRNVFTFGDWLFIGEETDKDALSQCCYGYSLSLVAKMCAWVGEDGSVYERWYEEAKAAFRNTYVQADGTLQGDTQTIYAVAYSIGFMSADEIKKPFINTIRRRGDTITTGFVGVKFLLPVLCELGATELAYKLITQTKFPSWGYCIENGATTIWERWNGYTKEHGFFDPSMNSFNHYSLGSCVYWLYAYVLGIRLTDKSATQGELLIKPVFSKALSWAKGSYQTKKGKISVAWEYEENNISLVVEADASLCLNYDFGAHSILSKECKNNTTIFKLSK